MRISDWSSDVCSSDLDLFQRRTERQHRQLRRHAVDLLHDQAQMTTQNAVVRTAVWRNLLAGRENREECGRGAGNLLQQPRRLRAVPPVFAAVHPGTE